MLGSTAYAAQHAAEADKIQAVLVLDNGTGMITGQALQGRKEFEQLWIDLLAPVTSLGAKTVRDANKGGTDHLSFIPYGVPGFNFKETRGYNHTHHSQVDTYDHAVASDLMRRLRSWGDGAGTGEPAGTPGTGTEEGCHASDADERHPVSR